MATTSPIQSPPSKMLSLVTRGRVQRPLNVVVYGVEGVGKTTLAVGAPAPIVLACESGSDELDVARLPISSWADLVAATRELASTSHAYQTIIIDTLDAAEALCWAATCEVAKKESIEDFGYGKGYVAALDTWRVLLAELERARAKGLHVVLIAHSAIRSANNPEGANFDRYEMKLHKAAGALFREWASAVLFARYETVSATTADKGGAKKALGVSTGRRVLETQHAAAFDAKNRYGLPVQIEMTGGGTWDTIVAHIEESRGAVPEIEALIAEAAKHHPEKAAQAREWLRAKPRTREELAAAKEKLTTAIAASSTEVAQ